MRPQQLRYPVIMRYIELPATDPRMPNKISLLGFGGAPLMGRAGRNASLLALHTAYERGINFFDTARSYGYGESERLLGEFLIGRRDSVVLCTKFGILPSARGGWKRKLKPLAQAAVNLFPNLRGIARRQAANQLVPGQFSVEVLHSSLEASLRNLRTDYVDILLMHDANEDAVANPELLEALERLVSAGTVRIAGVSGPHSTISSIFEQRPRGIKTVQFAVDPSSLGFLDRCSNADTRGFFSVGNHPFGGSAGVEVLKRALTTLRTDVTLAPETREKLCGDMNEIMPEVVFGCILEGTAVSAVVAAMINPCNLDNNIRAITHCRFSSEELTLFRRIIGGQSQVWKQEGGRPNAETVPSE